MQQLIKYLELHIMSLNQDLEQISARMESVDPNSKEYTELDIEYTWTSGQVSATSHIMDYVYEIA